MTIHYNVPGKKRKELAAEIGRWLEVDVEYLVVTATSLLTTAPTAMSLSG